MTHIQYIDELIREYLLFRGFAGTLKMFDIELKQDKEKGFRVSLSMMFDINAFNITERVTYLKKKPDNMAEKNEYEIIIIVPFC
jgi:hypothetical protein